MASTFALNPVVIDSRTASPGAAWCVRADGIVSGLVAGEPNVTTEPARKVASGTIMGKITASGKYRPVLLETNTAIEGPLNTIQVRDSSVFRVGDVIEFRQADGTLVSTGHNITVIPDALNITFDGAAVTTVAIGDHVLGLDGSQTAVGILLDATQSEVAFDDSGDPVTYDQAGQIVIRGIADQSELTGGSTPAIAALDGHFTFV